MISPDRWQKIQSLFQELVDVRKEDRALRLERVCGNDTDLRDTVQSLLDLDDERQDPVFNAIGSAAESLLEKHRDRLIGARVGPYRIVSILGHGGMSTVYRAERDDVQFKQTVAVKVLQHAVLHPHLRSRLHSERHILATLDHPGIARLIDSGDLEDGTSYLVMEYVDGAAIDAYCDARTLSIRDRIELFLMVCAAVHFAHRNLVVHRDIKPSNILVAGEGVPKLMDFGIAKLLSPESLSHTLPVTRLQERLLTPENAAPEQILGRRITTATDVYALGVLLYRLLSGRSPYRLLSFSQLQLERAICMDDPARPSQMAMAQIGSESDADKKQVAASRGLTPERLRDRLSGDLDAVIAMAMRKEPDRRYPSVEALAEDLSRHLTGQPVRARQGDWRYHGGKFLRRNFVAAAATVAAFAALSIIAGITLWENHRIGVTRDAAAQERDRAQKVSAFLVDVFSEADPFKSQGREATAKDLLDQGAARISGNLNLQPEVRAQLLESIGLAYRHQGLFERAIPLFEQAVAIRREEQPVDERLLTAALANLARALTDAGHMVSAEGYLQQALSMSKRQNSASVETAAILIQFGHFELAVKSDADHARQYFAEALAIYRHLPGDQYAAIASSLGGLASTASWAGDFAAAEQNEREALSIFRATVSRDHPDHAVALATLGYVLTQRGKYSEAEAALNEALGIERRVFGADNQRVASIEAYLGTLYDRQGDSSRAIAVAQDALRIVSATLGTGHYLTGYYHDSLAAIFLHAGDMSSAETEIRRALAIYAQTLPPQHLYIASSRQLLGEVLLGRQQLQAADRELRAALDIDMALLGEKNWRTARTEASLGWAEIAQDRAAEGEPRLAAAQRELLQLLGAQHPEAQIATARLADYYRAHHRAADASRIAASLGGT